MLLNVIEVALVNKMWSIVAVNICMIFEVATFSWASRCNRAAYLTRRATT